MRGPWARATAHRYRLRSRQLEYAMHSAAQPHGRASDLSVQAARGRQRHCCHHLPLAFL